MFSLKNKKDKKHFKNNLKDNEDNQKNFDESDSRMSSTIKLFEKTSLFKSLLKVVSLAVIVSLAMAIYVFADQVMMTQLIPKNANFSPEVLFGKDFYNSALNIINSNNLQIQTEVSTIIRVANSLSLPYIQICLAISLLFSLGISIPYSKNLGKKDKKEIASVWRNGFYSTLLFTTISSVLLILIAYILIPIQAGNASSQINLSNLSLSDKAIIDKFLLRYQELSIHYAQNYTYLIVGFNAFNCFSTLFATLLNSEGKNFIVTVLIIIGNLFNILFDFLLIQFTNLGMVGAALATNTSWVILIGMFITYIYVLNKKNATFLSVKYLNKIKLNWALVLTMLAIGSASFFRSTSNSILIFFLQTSYTEITPLITLHTSSYYLDILGTVQPIYALFFSSVIGVIRGARSVVSYNYARRKIDNVKKAFWLSLLMSCFWGLFFFCLVVYAIPEQMLWFFNVVPSNTIFYNDNYQLLQITMGQLPLFVLSISGMLYFQSTAKSFLSFLTSIINGFLVGIPFIFIFKAIALQTGNIFVFEIAPLAIMAISGLIIFIFSTWYLYFKDKLTFLEKYSKSMKKVAAF